MKPLRILIAEDSALFVSVLREILEAEPDLTVAGVAEDGLEAVAMCARLRPDLVLMDIHMPRMDGLSATEAIMGKSPTPILVITADPYRGGVDLSFKALSAGALDLIGKPTHVPMREAERMELLRKIRLLAEVPVVRHVRANLGRVGDEAGEGRALPEHVGRGEHPGVAPVVGVVASTGGPRALARLLGDLPADFPAAILVVQHITRGFSAHLARWLDANSALTVREAAHADQVNPGVVYIAPTDQQMEMTKRRLIKVYDGPVVAGYRPSGDVLLRSLARHAAPRAIGMVLSGMGNDGTLGLAALYRSGCTTLVQDEASSVVYSMPQSALDRGVVTETVQLDRLANRLVAVVDAQLEDDR